MIPNSIEREILIDAPVETVWSVVTEPDQIRQWFAEGVALDPRPGSAGTLTFIDQGSGHQHVVRLRVEAVEPPHLIAFRWDHPEGEEPSERNSLRVEFALAAEGDGTRLRVTESGFRELDRSEEDKASYVDDHRKGWDFYVPRLSDHASGQS